MTCPSNAPDACLHLGELLTVFQQAELQPVD
jgi:hypothetical protein